MRMDKNELVIVVTAAAIGALVEYYLLKKNGIK